MIEINIRLENDKDNRKVEEITREAFWRDERIDKIGVGATEHFMVYALRKNEGIRELTFIAEFEGEIIGNIVYSSGSFIERDNGSRLEVLNLGPLSVKPEYQGRGVGSKLIKYSLEKAKKLNYGAVFFYGHPEYYPRFGFRDASEYSITTDTGDNFPAFMGLELQDGYLYDVRGRFIESIIYNERYTSPLAKEFDEGFK